MLDAMSKHNIALVGAGNCGCSLVQAITSGTVPPGRLSPPFDDPIREIQPSTFRFVAAFDVDWRKINCDLSEAIFAKPNCTTKYKNVEDLGVNVTCGPLADGIGGANFTDVEPYSGAPSVSWDQVFQVLVEARTETVICFLPVGAQEASVGYARCALKAGANFINCSPAFIARDSELQSEFRQKGLVLLGDDLKSHLGASVIHGALTELFNRRGLQIDSMYQLNFGGNADFLNMLDAQRVDAKRETKNATIRRRLDKDIAMTIGPSGFVQHLQDNKVCYINVVGKGYLGMPFECDVKFRVEDSPNAAAVAVDMLRLVEASKANPDLLNDEVLEGYFKAPYTSSTERSVSKSHGASNAGP